MHSKKNLELTLNSKKKEIELPTKKKLDQKKTVK